MLRKFPVKPKRKFLVKRIKTISSYISTVSGRELDPNSGWQWDYCVSVGDRDTHDHLTFQMTNGVLLVYPCLNGTPGNGEPFTKFMNRIKKG